MHVSPSLRHWLAYACGAAGLTIACAASGLLTGCGGAGFEPAAHTPLPLLPRHAGAVLAAPELVTITFPGYAHTAHVQAFADFVGGSRWLAAVGADYGVVGATPRAQVVWPSAAPSALTVQSLRTLLTTAISDGTLPAPPASDSRLIYLVYLPDTTVLDASDAGSGVVCFRASLHTADEPFIQGFHEALRTQDDVLVPFAVIGDCGAGPDGVTATASRELIGAATNPYELTAAGYQLEPEPTDPWALAVESGEVGYMCTREEPIAEGGFALRRGWSNTEAAAGRHPCVPVPDGDLYFNVSASPNRILPAAPGETLSFTLTGWSTAPIGGWSLSLAEADTASLPLSSLSPKLSADHINNGEQVTLSLTVPASARSGQIGGVHVRSGKLGRIWPLGFTVK